MDDQVQRRGGLDHMRIAAVLLIAEGLAVAGLGALIIIGGLLPAGMTPLDFPGLEGNRLANALFFGVIGLVPIIFGWLLVATGRGAGRGRRRWRTTGIVLATLATIVGLKLLTDPSSSFVIPTIAGAAAAINAYVVTALIRAWRDPDRPA